MPLASRGRTAVAAATLFFAVLAGLARDSSPSESRPGQAGAWRWREAAVETQADHLEVFYGSPDDPERWVLVARVGKPQNRVFPVQWLVNSESAELSDAIRAVRGDLDYYLITIGQRDPWSYARFHCGTASNLYGYVHWARARARNGD
jgi:hypothetical protein